MRSQTKAEAPAPEAYMARALSEARLAARRGEVPVGAVVVYQGQIIAAASNAPVQTHDPTAHAEILALRAAAAQLGNYRLAECSMYVSLEPCAMCASAVMQARLKKLVFAAPEPKTGAAGSVLDLFADRRLNHQTQVESGLLAAQSRALLQTFFKARRAQKAQSRELLRQDALRTAEACFAPWPTAPMVSQYWQGLDGLDGLRLHGLCFQTEGPSASGDVMCLHGARSWSHAWRDLCVGEEPPGYRMVCPDLPGFGRSDKPKRVDAHRLDWHARILAALLTHLGFEKVLLLTHPDMRALAQMLQARSEKIREVRVWPLPALPRALQDAPFPHPGFRAGPTAFQKWIASAESD